MKPSQMQRNSDAGSDRWFASAVVESVHIDHQDRRRTVTVGCPFCARYHHHDWPLGRNYVGVVTAPCRDMSDESAIAAVGLIALMDYAAIDQDRYQVWVGRGFDSDCEPRRKQEQ